MLLPLNILAAGGLLFAFEHATVAGKVVLGCLLVGSIFSWSIMVTKLRIVRFARKQSAPLPQSLPAGSAAAAALRKSTRAFPVRRSSMSIAPVARR